MAWTEDATRRTRHSRTYTDDTSGTRRLVASLAPLHYDSGGSWEPIDLTPQRITNAQLDGWRVTNNGWTYALGQRNGAGADGWVGFGKRGHAFWFRLARYGYVRTTNLAFQDVGGAPSYQRANLSSQAGTHTIGPNADPITPKSLATWSAIWPGVNLRWALRGDQLKEEVILTSAARAALPAPTTPLGQTWFVWAYQVDWSDVPKRIINGLEVAAGADSGQITGAMELRTALDETIGFLPLDRAWVQTNPDDSLSRTYVNLRKRFYTQGGTPWLVVGLPVSELTGLPAGDIVFDPTINEAVAANADDGTWVPSISAFDSTTCVVGRPTAASNAPTHLFVRFQTVAIPAGATINTATMEFVKSISANPTTANAIIYANDVDDATAPTTSAGAEALALTTASTAWNAIATGADGAVYTTPSIVSPLQEVIDRAGWASDNDLQFVVKDNVSSNGASREFAAIEHATYAAPELDVVYTESGATKNASDADTRTGTDTATLSASGDASDASTLSGTDAATLAVTGSAADASTLTGTDAAAISLALSDADTLAGADTGSLSAVATQADTDTLGGTDVASLAATLAGSDLASLAGTDLAGTTATLAGADTDPLTGSDAAVVTTEILLSAADSDPLAGSDLATLVSAVMGADSDVLTGADTTLALGAVQTVADSDALSGTDAATVSTENEKTSADTDLLAGAETGSVTVVLGSVDLDSLLPVETGAGSAAVIATDSDALTGSDSAVAEVAGEARSGADLDLLAGVDVAAVIVTASAVDSDPFSGTELLTIAALLSAADVATLVGVDAATTADAAALPTWGTVAVIGHLAGELTVASGDGPQVRARSHPTATVRARGST